MAAGNKGSVLQTWSKTLSNGHYAIAVFSTRTDGTPHESTFSLAELNITQADAYSLYDLYEKKSIGKFNVKDKISVYVVPSGIRMFRALPISLTAIESIGIEVMDIEF